jgi:16S rRNA G966 N2-methylase RsmD
VQNNLEHTGLAQNAQVKNMDFSAFLVQNREPFDLAFLDPPYRTGLVQRALPMVAETMNRGGSIICENPVDEDMPESAGDFVKVRSYRYGKIVLTLYRHKDVTQE